MENAELRRQLTEVDRKLDHVLEMLKKSEEGKSTESTTKRRRMAKTAARSSASKEEMETDQQPSIRKIQQEERRARLNNKGKVQTTTGTTPKPDNKETGRGADNKGGADNKEGADSGKIPPAVLNKADEWTFVSRRLQACKIGYTKAKMTGKAVAITPATS